MTWAPYPLTSSPLLTVCSLCCCHTGSLAVIKHWEHCCLWIDLHEGKLSTDSSTPHPNSRFPHKLFRTQFQIPFWLPLVDWVSHNILLKRPAYENHWAWEGREIGNPSKNWSPPLRNHHHYFKAMKGMGFNPILHVIILFCVHNYTINTLVEYTT